MNYVELRLAPSPYQPWNEIIIAKLAEEGFESFDEVENEVLAYIQEKDFDISLITSLKNWASEVTFSLDVRHTIIAQQNWNANWEAQFSPIVLDDWCGIRAPFHEALKVEHEIVIEPKMSFGTGHHQTTYMMMEMIRELNIKEKEVLDMGSGTGILAILARKLGANYVEGIDNEIWAYENAIENAERNNTESIVFKHGEKEAITHKSFDVVLANINRNILIDMMPELEKATKSKGNLVLSGFLVNDKEVMMEHALKAGFQWKNEKIKDNWLSLCFEKK